MAGRNVAVKKYVVRLGEDERRQLEEMVRKGKSPAQRLLKARILLKADVSESGEDWSRWENPRGVGYERGDGLSVAQAIG